MSMKGVLNNHNNKTWLDPTFTILGRSSGLISKSEIVVVEFDRLGISLRNVMIEAVEALRFLLICSRTPLN